MVPAEFAGTTVVAPSTVPTALTVSVAVVPIADTPATQARPPRMAGNRETSMACVEVRPTSARVSDTVTLAAGGGTVAVDEGVAAGVEADEPDGLAPKLKVAVALEDTDAETDAVSEGEAPVLSVEVAVNEPLDVVEEVYEGLTPNDNEAVDEVDGEAPKLSDAVIVEEALAPKLSDADIVEEALAPKLSDAEMLVVADVDAEAPVVRDDVAVVVAD